MRIYDTEQLTSSLKSFEPEIPEKRPFYDYSCHLQLDINCFMYVNSKIKLYFQCLTTGTRMLP
jgi:hypothetical protein